MNDIDLKSYQIVFYVDGDNLYKRGITVTEANDRLALATATAILQRRYEQIDFVSITRSIKKGEDDRHGS
jgi:hypothetical protein